MKLYAILNNERKGRPAKKGANEAISITLSRGNKDVYTFIFTETRLQVLNHSSGNVQDIEEFIL